MAALSDETPPTRPRFTVRQGGGGDEDGLLKQMTGPAALWGIDLDGGPHMSAIAGTTKASAGDRRYLALRTSLSAAGNALRLTYASDDHDGAAMEARLKHSFGPVALTFSQTFNWGFESPWTGTGNNQASHITEGWVSGTVASLPVGVGLRETFRRDGRQATDLQTYQMFTFGAVTVMNTTTTALTAAATGWTSGSLMAMGTFRSLTYTAELDYGEGGRMRPTGARLSFDTPLAGAWDFYADVYRPLPRGREAIDFGATRELGGFLVGPFVSGSTQGGSIGIRLWLPLYPAERSHPWFGPYYDSRQMDRPR